MRVVYKAVLAATIVVAIVVYVLTLCVSIGRLCSNGPTTSQESQSTSKRHDAMTCTYDNKGNRTNYYVMVDPDTGIQYVVNDKGGMCPRLRKDGTVFGTEQSYE